VDELKRALEKLGIHITDNAIIPLKERVVDLRYDPIWRAFRRVFGRKSLELAER
jgi:succinate dehydrogenase / fumarate reductase iron-sulfur subunit